MRLAAALAVSLACLLGAGALAPAPVLAAEVSDARVWSAEEPPELSSPAAFLVEPTTGKVLLEKGADERREPASTTKVMTALLVLENMDLDAEVTVEAADFEEVTADSSVAGLVAGETLTVRDLLACLLLPSGNDASYVLARAVAGDWQSFVEMMNERAAELGCEGTHFANPCGLHDDEHYTTARDLATIFMAAMEHPEFMEIAGALSWDLPATTQNPARTLENTNLLIDPESPVYMDGVVTAGKTGTTGDAGRCLVVSAEGEDISLVGVVLGADFAGVDELGVGDNFYDMRSMVEWGVGAWRTGDVVVPGDVVGRADVMLSSDGSSVDALAAGGVSTTVPRDADVSYVPAWEGVDPETGSFHAPIEEGQELGTVDVLLDGEWLATLPMVSAGAMELSVPDFILWWLSDPLHAAIVVVALVAVFVVIGVVAGASRRKSRSRYQMAVGKKPVITPGPGSQSLKLPSKKKAPAHGKHSKR